MKEASTIAFASSRFHLHVHGICIFEVSYFILLFASAVCSLVVVGYGPTKYHFTSPWARSLDSGVSLADLEKSMLFNHGPETSKVRKKRPEVSKKHEKEIQKTS